MSDWGNAFDEQCRTEGLEVPEKVEEDEPTSEMDQVEENKGFGGSGIGRGGMFGGPPKAAGAPPPQTSFGSTSGMRVGGSFGSSAGPDGRGSAIGTTDDVAGGGNVISVANRRDNPACFPTRGGAFGSNRSMAPCPPTVIKTNHEGGRFGTLAPKTFSGVNPTIPNISNSGSSQVSKQSSVGGSFGMKSSVATNSCETKPISSFGGAFGSRPSNSNQQQSHNEIPRKTESNTFAVPDRKIVTSEKTLAGATRYAGSSGAIGGGFGKKPSEEEGPSKPTFGGAFGSKSSMGGSFGRKSSPAVDTSSRTIPANTTMNEKKVYQVKLEDHGKDVCFPAPTRPACGGAFGSKVSTGQTMGGSFGRKPSPVTESSSNPISERTPIGEKIVDQVKLEDREKDICFPAPTRTAHGGAFGSKSSATQNVGGSFGRKPTMDDNQSSRAISGNFLMNEEKDDAREKITGFTAPTRPACGGAFGSKSSTSQGNNIESGNGFNKPQFSNRAPSSGSFGLFKSNLIDEKENNSRPRFEEDNRTIRSDAHSFSRSDRTVEGSNQRESENFGTRASRFDGKEEGRFPFSSGPPMRGAFQGGFRGGRGSLGGGQMDFANGGQGHGMGRGRGQPAFVPQQRGGAPPPFVEHQTSQPPMRPDSRYKYTKPVDDDHEKVPVPADIALLNKLIHKEVKMMKNTVVDVQRLDPKSPLYSISSFRELRLKPEVLQALDALGFQFPTRIQETALPLLLMEPPSNLIAQAQSGTGKTAAFVLTMLCRIDVNLKCPQCICLAPTLELAKQIGEVVEKMGKFIENLKIHYAIKGGNMAAMRGRKLTEQIVIGTPGITRDYLQKYHCIDPSQIRCLVLDEADVMIYHQGFTDISTTIYKLVEEASSSVQSMLFSATYDEPVINFATKLIKNAIVVMLKREEQALPNIQQYYVQCACRDSKYAAIVNLYSGLAVASSVIFCHTKASVMWLFENMRGRGHQVDVLHGDMNVVERADTIIRFKRGDFRVLITTNVFARGIDVAQVSVVINYDLPIKYNEQDTPMVIDGFTQPDCETYLHRIGRTGRFGKTGIAINLIDSEDSMNMISILENHFQMKIARMDPSNLEDLEAIERA